MNDYPKRKRVRIDNYDYSTQGAYFITICTANKEKIFWEGADAVHQQDLPLSIEGKIAEQGVLQMEEHYESIFVDKYCIMPDHIHLILRIVSDTDGRMISAPTVSTAVGSMKRWVSKHIGRPVWQKSFYDHCIRNQQDYNEISEYIDNNPLKYKLKNNGTS